MELSEIALQKLLQLFPELSSYIVSFKDISDDSGIAEDGPRVGMFLLRFGQEYYYLPVMAKDETVYPLDSIFSAAGEFIPLTKSMVDKVMASATISTGRAAKIPKTVPLNPSVQDLVTPPRTGKFVYASSSRMVEFLANMPNFIKKATLEKFSQDSEVYNTLHRLFGLEDMLAALKPSYTSAVKVVSKPAVEVISGGEGLGHDSIQDILEKGYSLKGENTSTRVAVLANDFEHSGVLQRLDAAEAGRCISLVTKEGQTREAFYPKKARGGPLKVALLHSGYSHGADNSRLVVFSNGEYSTNGDLVFQGEPSGTDSVLAGLLTRDVPITVSRVHRGTKVAIFNQDMALIDALDIYSVVDSTSGTILKGASLVGNGSVIVNAFRNSTTVDISDPKNIFVPANTLAVVLGNDCSGDFEESLISALKKRELVSLSALGSTMDLGFDGVEFSVNGKPASSEAKVIEILVVHEGLDPAAASNFIKKAKDLRKVKIYLSKKADFEPGEIPQFGDAPQDQENNFGSEAQANFSNNLKASVKTQDPQAIESTIISELLQASSMNDLVREYTPDISKAVDRLGRTLFLARLNTEKLSKSQNATEVASFIANLRNVYRLLGDNVIKLERISATPDIEQSGVTETD